MTKKTMICPHREAECAVWRTGNRCCPECGKIFRVDCFDIIGHFKYAVPTG